MNNKCQCGCGQPVKKGNRYIRHHLAYKYKAEGRPEFTQFFNPNWKGSMLKTTWESHPMILMYAPQNRNANSSGRVSQQRLLVEKKLGRELDATERVIRKNPNKTDFIDEKDLLGLYVKTQRIKYRNRDNGEYHFESGKNNTIKIVEYMRVKHGYNKLLKLKEYI